MEEFERNRQNAREIKLIKLRSRLAEALERDDLDSVGARSYDIAELTGVSDDYIKAFNILSQTTQTCNLLMCCIKLAEHYQRCGDKQKAIDYYKIAISVSEPNNLLRWSCDKYREEIEKLNV